jgi:WD40 repeat protein
MIYSPQNFECLRELQGLLGKVLDLAVYDSRNQVIGLGSVNSCICVWDFMTSYLLLELRYPTLFQGVFPTRFKLFVKEGTQLMLVGLSEGSLTLNSYVYDADNSDYRLIPYKIITSTSSEVVSAVDYDSDHDITLVGDCRSSVFVYNHLESAPVEQSGAALSSKPKQSRTSMLSKLFRSSSGDTREHELAELKPAPEQSSLAEAHSRAEGEDSN